jgi:hypothetical protein
MFFDVRLDRHKVLVDVLRDFYVLI